MCRLAKYGIEAASDIDENGIWFWMLLLDLHDSAGDLIAEHMARLEEK